MVCIKLNAGHDSNGNPRRVYVLLNCDGSIVRAVNEGYRGIGALRELPGCEEWSEPVEFDTTPREYRKLLRDFSGK